MDVMTLPFIVVTSTRRFLQRHKTNILVSGAVEETHDLHDCAVVGRRVAAHEDALFVAGLGDCGELWNQFFERNRRLGFLAEIDQAFLVDGR
jgi:hypothetical protein